MTYDQVWWPILGICALHLSHPKCTHTALNTHTPWTRTWSSGQPFMLRCPGSSWGFGALLKGTSVVVLRVERALYIHCPHLQFQPGRNSNSQPFNYESDSLTIRPWLPQNGEVKKKQHFKTFYTAKTKVVPIYRIPCVYFQCDFNFMVFRDSILIN